MVVDDHEVVREGLAAALVDDDVELVGTAATAAEAVELADRQRPDVAIVDLRLPDLGGVELIARLREVAADVAVVVLSTYLDEVTVQACLDAGARAYVTKAAGVAELRRAVREVAAGEGRQAPVRAADVVRRLHGLVGNRTAGARVSPQQERVLSLVAAGLTNQQVANRLSLSESTVRFHLQKLKDVLDTQTRSQLVAKAVRLRIIEPYVHHPDVHE